jgi:hypothetical protein
MDNNMNHLQLIKMTMKRELLILLLIALTSCNSGTTNKKESATAVKPETVGLSVEQQPAKTIIDFLTWYRENRDRLGKIKLVNNVDKKESASSKFYSVNLKNTEVYLMEIQKSTFVSDAYINDQRQYFKKCSQQLKETPQYDGPPAGFEFDLILLSQDYEEDLANLDKSIVTAIDLKDKNAKLKLTFQSESALIFTISKNNGQWLIDKIENGRTD